jgi:hypothetical protein
VRVETISRSQRAQIEQVMGFAPGPLRAICHRLLCGSVSPLLWSMLEPGDYAAVMAMSDTEMLDAVDDAWDARQRCRCHTWPRARCMADGHRPDCTARHAGVAP